MTHTDNEELTAPIASCDYCGHQDAPLGYLALVGNLDTGDFLHAAPPARVVGISRFIACSIFCMERIVSRYARISAIADVATDEPRADRFARADEVMAAVDDALTHPERLVRRTRPRRLRVDE